MRTVVRYPLLCALLATALALPACNSGSGDGNGEDTPAQPFVTIGTASKPVRFDWRRTTIHLMGTASRPAELNNFESLRAGGTVPR